MKRRNWLNAGHTDCYDPWERPAGDLGVRTVLLKWKKDTKEAVICRPGNFDWSYTTSNAYGLVQSKNWQSAPCKFGHYSTIAGYKYRGPFTEDLWKEKWYNSWNGVESGNGWHYLPT